MPNAPQPPETVRVDEANVSCDGGDGVLGHPRVFLSLAGKGRVECPYCDRLFVLDGAPAPAEPDPDAKPDRETEPDPETEPQR